MAQSTEHYRLNTYMYIDIMNVVKTRRQFSYTNTTGRRCTGIDNYIYIYTHTHTHIHTRARARTHTHAHKHRHTTRMHTHTHKCADTNTIQTVGAKDNTQMKYLEKRNVLSLFLKEGRKLECLTSDMKNQSDQEIC